MHPTSLTFHESHMANYRLNIFPSPRNHNSKLPNWLIGAHLRIILSCCSGALRFGVSGKGTEVVSPRAAIFSML